MPLAVVAVNCLRTRIAKQFFEIYYVSIHEHIPNNENDSLKNATNSASDSNLFILEPLLPRLDTPSQRSEFGERTRRQVRFAASVTKRSRVTAYE